MVQKGVGQGESHSRLPAFGDQLVERGDTVGPAPYEPHRRAGQVCGEGERDQKRQKVGSPLTQERQVIHGLEVERTV